MPTSNLRRPSRGDRRRVPRGGRRPTDRPGRHPVLLVAESSEDVRRRSVEYLDHFSFRVTEAANGDEVLSAVNTALPQVILTELTLPKMPAWRLSRWLANNFRTRDIPLIVMADEFGEDVEPRLGQPAGVLLKPFTLATMLDEVRRVLRAQMAM